MRIATWNMDHWRRSRKLREEAWEFLRNSIRPDIALLQEAVPPSGCNGVVFREGGLHDDRLSPPRNLGWGSAVVSFGPRIRPIIHATSPFYSEPISLLRTFPGCVAVAEVDDDPPLVVVSAYGLIDRGYAGTTVHRILSDLTPLVDERRGRRLVVAGDLNITTQWSEKHRSFCRGRHEECLLRDRNLFERFAALGFHNLVVRAAQTPLEGCECNAGSECRHVQTQRHDRSRFPWQNDYIFVSGDLLDQRPGLQVFDDEAAWRLSSHCPVAIDLTSDPHAALRAKRASDPQVASSLHFAE